MPHSCVELCILLVIWCHNGGDTLIQSSNTDTVVSFTYAIIIFNVDISFLVDKGSDFVNLALLNS